MARRPIRGIARVRRLMRRLPDLVGQEIVVELFVTGRRMVAAVLARTPRKSGALAAGISQKVLPKSLRLQIGLLGTPRGRARLFYGRIQDLGRTEQVVRVTRRVKARQIVGNNRNGSIRQTLFRVTETRMRRRGPNKGTPIGSPYNLRVRGSQPKRFVTGRYPDLRAELNKNLRGIFARALSKAGAGDDA